MLLESLAASALAAQEDRPAAVTALRNAVADMERWAAANLEDRIEADLKFHRTMCHLSGNETLLHSWSSLEGSIRMSIMFAGGPRAEEHGRQTSSRHRRMPSSPATPQRCGRHA